MRLEARWRRHAPPLTPPPPMLRLRDRTGLQAILSNYNHLRFKVLYILARHLYTCEKNNELAG